MFQKINEEKKNQDCDKDKAHVSRNESERKFNCNNFFVHFNFKRHRDLNKKEYKTKNEQIVERTSF